MISGILLHLNYSPISTRILRDTKLILPVSVDSKTETLMVTLNLDLRMSKKFVFYSWKQVFMAHVVQISC